MEIRLEIQENSIQRFYKRSVKMSELNRMIFLVLLVLKILVVVKAIAIDKTVEEENGMRLVDTY